MGSTGAQTCVLLGTNINQVENTAVENDTFTNHLFSGYYQGTLPWLSSGFAYYTQLQTSMAAFNIATSTTSTSTWATSKNLLLTDAGQLCLNTATPGGSYQLTMAGTATCNGITLTGSSTMFELSNTLGTTSARTSMVMTATNGTTWEWSMGNSAHAVVPNGLYWYQGSTYRMVLTSGGRLGIGTTTPRCGLEIASSLGVSQTTVDIATNTYRYNVSTGS